MADLERTRTRERDPGTMTPYDIFIRSRLEFLDRQNTGQVVVSLDDREYFNTKQGKLLYYINAEIHKNTCLQDWRVFTHSLISHSGRHRHQGGLVIYVIEGTGYSGVDGERETKRFRGEGGQRYELPQRMHLLAVSHTLEINRSVPAPMSDGGERIVLDGLRHWPAFQHHGLPRFQPVPSARRNHAVGRTNLLANGDVVRVAPEPHVDLLDIVPKLVERRVKVQIGPHRNF